MGLEVSELNTVAVLEANWTEARRPSCGEALVANPVKDNFGLATATVSVSFASFAFSGAACVDAQDASLFVIGN